MRSVTCPRRSKRRIDRQLVALCIGATLAATTVALGVSLWGYERLTDTATAAQDAAAASEIANQTQATLALVQAQSDAVQAKVDADLRVARYILDERGALTVDGDPEPWQAINQYTKAVTEIDLPAMTIGDEPLPKNANLAFRTPIIDDVHDLVGGTTTIFQRMNDEGDMLRVATNVETLDGDRAIGTFIPATNPDGAPNPVVSTVLRGETYRGIAYVVNAWYVTAYEPIFDDAGTIVGILYVGVRQENIASMRAAIETTTVLDNGVVAVVGGTGDDAGVPIISAQFTEGQPLTDAATDDGAWLTELLDDAVAAPGEVVPGRRTTLEGMGPVVVEAAYFQPWDWVVLTITPERDLTALSDELQDTSASVLRTLLIVAVLAAAAVGVVAWRIAHNIGGVFRRHAGTAEAGVANMSRAAGAVADNVESTAAASRSMQATSTEVAETTATVASATEQLNASFSVAAGGASQIGEISREAVQAIETASSTIERLATSSSEIDRFTEIINGIAEQTKLLALNATIEAARAGEAGRGFAVVASEVKDLAAATGRATEEIASQIAQIQNDAASARQDVERVATVTGELNAVQQTLVSSVGQQQLTSNEIATSISRAAAGVQDLARQADAVAEVSQRSGEAVRQAGDCIGNLESAIDELRATVGTGGRVAAVEGGPATPAAV